MLIAQKRKFTAPLLVAALLVLIFSTEPVRAQEVTQNLVQPGSAGEKSTRVDPPAPVKSRTAAGEGNSSNEERLGVLERALEQQNAKLDQLQKLILEQQQTIQLLAGKLSGGETPPALTAVSASVAPAPAQPAQAPGVEDRLKKVEGRVSDIGPVKFSGDIRLRSESFFGLSNSLPNGDNPAVLGNELSMRHRMRLRARLTMRGAIGERV